MGTWRGCSPRSVPSHIGGATRLWLVLALALAAAVGGCGGAERDEAVEVKALWYGTAADGTTVGGTAPVEIRAVEDDPQTPLSLDVGGLRAAGAGPMWTAATAVAEVQAVLISGVDPRLHQLQLLAAGGDRRPVGRRTADRRNAGGAPGVVGLAVDDDDRHRAAGRLGRPGGRRGREDPCGAGGRLHPCPGPTRDRRRCSTPRPARRSTWSAWGARGRAGDAGQERAGRVRADHGAAGVERPRARLRRSSGRPADARAA